jgi:hypothetical protein
MRRQPNAGVAHGLLSDGEHVPATSLSTQISLSNKDHVSLLPWNVLDISPPSGGFLFYGQDNPKGILNSMGAPKGNTNSSKNNRLWAETIRRAVVQSDAERLRRIAEALLNKAEEGDIQAIKEVGDRLDGKPTQTIAGAGEDGEHVIRNIGVVFRKPDNG